MWYYSYNLHKGKVVQKQTHNIGVEIANIGKNLRILKNYYFWIKLKIHFTSEKLSI
jgi:hypothetical protein